jgi:hypothetical protein
MLVAVASMQSRAVVIKMSIASCLLPTFEVSYTSHNSPTSQSLL